MVLVWEGGEEKKRLTDWVFLTWEIVFSKAISNDFLKIFISSSGKGMGRMILWFP